MNEAVTELASQGMPADYRYFLRDAGLDFALEERQAPDSGRIFVPGPGKLSHAMGRITDLSWDSEFFGAPAGRIEGMFFSENASDPAELRQDLISALTEYAEIRGLTHLTCRIRADDFLLSQALENNGYRLADIMVIYQQRLANKKSAIGNETAAVHDTSGILSLIRRSVAEMRWGRVFNDPRISRKTAENFYLETSRHYLNTGAHVSTLSEDGRIVGAAIGVTDPGLSDQLGMQYGYLWLIIIDPDFRVRGCGKALFEKFCGEFAEQCDLLEIGTQLDNAAANAIYRGAGCRIRSNLCTFHRWNTE